MIRFLLILLFVNKLWSFNIENNDPAFVRPNDPAAANRDPSTFFGYEIRFGFGSDDALK